MQRALVLGLTLAAISCGKKDRGQDDSGPAKLIGTQGQGPAPESAGPADGSAGGSGTGAAAADAADQLVGTYEQVDNRQSKIRIDATRLVQTNLVIASPAGDGTRVSPTFPQQLQFDAAKGIYTTVGSYNDGNSVLRNVELRLRSYDNGRLLDVTLAVAGLGGSGTDGQGRGRNERDGRGRGSRGNYGDGRGYGDGYGYGYGSYSYRDAEDMCCPPEPCDTPTGQDGATGELLYQFRYEKVVAARGAQEPVQIESKDAAGAQDAPPAAGSGTRDAVDNNGDADADDNADDEAAVDDASVDDASADDASADDADNEAAVDDAAARGSRDAARTSERR